MIPKDSPRLLIPSILRSRLPVLQLFRSKNTTLVWTSPDRGDREFAIA